MRHPKLILAAGLAVLGLQALAAAQANPQNPDRQRFRENIVTLRLLRLTQALDLTEDQTVKVYPLVTKAEKEKLEAQRTMGNDLRNLRSLLNDSSPKEGDIASLVGSILETRAKIRGIDEAADASLAKLLTPVQRGKYILFQVDFFRGLGESLNQIRQRRGMPAPPPKK